MARIVANSILRYDPPMRWLLIGNLTSAVAAALVRHEHKVENMSEADLPPGSPAAEILKIAQKKQVEVLTNDSSLVDEALEYGFARSVVYLQLEGGDVEQDDAIDRLFERYKRLSPGRLYTVTASRVKIRQLPTAPRP
jgi:predicted nuclease of predicted toxin-antitoxin system